MDRLEALGNSLSQITMYDIKSMYNQAKNVVLNVSEIEAKVREATNDDPWGASSTLMQDIANRTFNYPDFNEIMPSIYSRFMEKEARQWRQIYKSLQLLEYLIKNGSERVVDDARSHVSTIKMLRNFHYIDDKGKDEGINVRNRSRELVELLSDVDKIRSERRKAKANKNKYTGTGSDGFSFTTSDGSRYGGFGSESGYGGGSSAYGGSSADRGSNDYYGSGSGGSGGRSSGFRDERRSATFDEYDAGGDELNAPTPTSRSPPTRRSTAPTATTAAPPPAPAPAPAPIVNLFDDDDVGSFNSPPAPAPPAKTLTKPVAPVNVFDDDDFGDFQTVPTQAAPAPAPAAPAPSTKPTFLDLMGSTPTPMAQPAKPIGLGLGGPANTTMGMGMGIQQGQGHRYGGSMSSPPIQPQQAQAPNYMSPITLQAQPARAANNTPSTANTSAAAKSSGGGFDDLWSMSLGAGSGSKPATPSGGGKSMKDLEKEKADAGLWGGGQQQQAKPKQPTMGMGVSGGFGAMGGSSSSGGGGIDDLLG
ncbi:Epsin domain-containing protein [Mycena indigotica]|uniref:Epsin domain-containing protein n=1 Tax=Mycena indigotica TaxID=2126181 RepID=A0A8H6SH49_9AGAR|nr:Epsin domain-containing protein [Mycena indigotica]KAF7299525.1 Epsin domain-containing protein [Mycena indigotica]